MDNRDFFGFVLNNDGAAQEISFNEIDSFIGSEHNVWLHFNHTNQKAIEWIENSKIGNIAIEALLADETRPRVIALKDSLLLALRGVNLDPDSKPEDMKSLRLYICEKLIISTSKSGFLSIDELVNELRHNNGVKNSSEFLVELIYKMTDKIDAVIDSIGDRADNVEESIFEDKSDDERTNILLIRREIILLKRYLTPQKEALIRLYNSQLAWLDEYKKIELREITDQLIRHIEELDTIKDKIILIQDEVSNILNEQLNKKMYILAILSAIFLPLTFLTGLFGVNLGGIPGAESNLAFFIFVGVLFATFAVQFTLLKHNKWI